MGCLAHVRPVLHHWRVVFGFGIISMLMRFPRRELRGLCAGRSSPVSLPPSARRVMWSPSPLGLVLLVVLSRRGHAQRATPCDAARRGRAWVGRGGDV